MEFQREPRRFEFVGGGSSKFWEISYRGPEVTVRFGRIGTNGQTHTKNLGSETAAAFHVAKLIEEKLGKGYVAVSRKRLDATRSPRDEVDFQSGVARPPGLPPYEPPPPPEDGPVDIDGIRLPAGRRLRGTPSMSPPGIEMVDGPVAWLTDAPLAESGGILYQLRRPASVRGQVPMLLSGLDADDQRPWDSHEFAPTDPRRIDHFSVDQVLADMWMACFDQEDEESFAALDPYGKDFPGVAPRSAGRVPSGLARLFSRAVDPDDDRAALKSIPSRRVALVAASRPADVITALGWTGAVNIHEDPALMSVVLRSWEDRWMARLVEIGFDTLTLTVGAPPSDRQTAQRLAAEHFAFCPDVVWQGTTQTVGAYGDLLIGSRLWSFWWD